MTFRKKIERFVEDLDRRYGKSHDVTQWSNIAICLLGGFKECELDDLSEQRPVGFATYSHRVTERQLRDDIESLEAEIVRRHHG